MRDTSPVITYQPENSRMLFPANFGGSSYCETSICEVLASVRLTGVMKGICNW